MILNEVIPGKLWQGDLHAAVDLCVNSGKFRSLADGEALRGVLVPAFDFRFNYDRRLHVLLLAQHDDVFVEPAQFDLAVEFYRTFAPILVHCHAGKSRSVAYTAAICYSVARWLPEYTYEVCGSTPERETDIALREWCEEKGRDK